MRITTIKTEEKTILEYIRRKYLKYLTMICFVFFSPQILSANESQEILSWPIEHLFHGSPKRGIKKFIPNNLKRRARDDKKYVYYSPSIAFASTFMINWDDSWCRLFVTAEGQVCFFTKDIERLKSNDLGGSLYIVANNSSTQQASFSMYEFLSEYPATVQAEIVFDSATKAMSQFGVEIISVDEEVFYSLNNNNFINFAELSTLKAVDV